MGSDRQDIRSAYKIFRKPKGMSSLGGPMSICEIILKWTLNMYEMKNGLVSSNPISQGQLP
jgi:hypothetical protein